MLWIERIRADLEEVLEDEGQSGIVHVVLRQLQQQWVERILHLFADRLAAAPVSLRSKKWQKKIHVSGARTGPGGGGEGGGEGGQGIDRPTQHPTASLRIDFSRRGFSPAFGPGAPG